MTISATDEERGIMKDFYTLFENVYDMGGSEKEWKDFITEANSQINKHKGMARQLAYYLFMALIDYKGEQEKARNQAQIMQPVQEAIPWS